MIDLAFIVLIWLYCSTILKRDKQNRKEFKAIGEQIKKEEKRKLREERLHSVRQPGVLYISDYRLIPPTQPKTIA
jgi:hypothetical protein